MVFTGFTRFTRFTTRVGDHPGWSRGQAGARLFLLVAPRKSVCAGNKHLKFRGSDCPDPYSGTFLPFSKSSKSCLLDLLDLLDLLNLLGLGNRLDGSLRMPRSGYFRF